VERAVWIVLLVVVLLPLSVTITLVGVHNWREELRELADDHPSRDRRWIAVDAALTRWVFTPVMCGVTMFALAVVAVVSAVVG
jgi:hypothetical protein